MVHADIVLFSSTKFTLYIFFFPYWTFPPVFIHNEYIFLEALEDTFNNCFFKSWVLILTCGSTWSNFLWLLFFSMNIFSILYMASNFYCVLDITDHMLSFWILILLPSKRLIFNLSGSCLSWTQTQSSLAMVGSQKSLSTLQPLLFVVCLYMRVMCQSRIQERIYTQISGCLPQFLVISSRFLADLVLYVSVLWLSKLKCL